MAKGADEADVILRASCSFFVRVLFYAYMNSRFFVLAFSLAFLGAGCVSSSGSTPVAPATPEPTPAGTAPATTPGGTAAAGGYFGSDQRAQVPSDIPLYPQPQGVLMGVTGYGEGVSVAQMTQDPATQVIEWLKTEFPRHGASFKSSTVAGNVTTIVFESADHRYSVNVEAGSGGTFFTVQKGTNNAVLGR